MEAPAVAAPATAPATTVVSVDTKAEAEVEPAATAQAEAVAAAVHAEIQAEAERDHSVPAAVAQRRAEQLRGLFDTARQEPPAAVAATEHPADDSRRQDA